MIANFFRIAALILSLNLQADSFPFNKARTHVGVPYTVITLTPEQQIEVERTHKVTLNPRQKKLIRRLSNFTPPALEILPSHYDDCSCGMVAIAVWFKNGEVEVPHSFLPNEESEFIEFGQVDNSRFGITIDTQGQLWINNQKLNISSAASKLQSIHEQLIKTHRAPSEAPWGLVFTPPERCIHDRKSFMRTLNHLRDAVEKLGLTLSAPPYIKDSDSEGQ